MSTDRTEATDSTVSRGLTELTVRPEQAAATGTIAAVPAAGPAGQAGPSTSPIPAGPSGGIARADIAIDALREVYDPELGLDVVSLGLIYDLSDLGDAGLRIDMTLTTPGCPVSDALPREAQAAVEAALVGVPVEINVVWDPPWTPERLSEEALDQLGFRR